MTHRGALWTRSLVSVLTLATFVGSVSYLLAARTRLERVTMPAPSASPSLSAASPGGAASAYGIAVRLTDLMSSASISSPRSGERAERGILIRHWRRHPSPYQETRPEVARMVQVVGLTQSEKGPDAAGNLSQETKPKSPERKTGFKGLAEQDQEDRRIKVFGLGEGTHDERECIVVAQPSTLRFRLRVPKQARLRVAPAVLGNGDVTFHVAFRPSAGAQRRELASARVHGPTKQFRDWGLDLAALGIAESEGELELSTEATSHEPLVALWGSPVILAPNSSSLPYNLLFIIVDAMRSDAISAAHDAAEDRAKRSAKLPPLDAWFEAIPQVAPELDRLATGGTVWSNSWSAAMWTRPSTVSLLTGMRASHTGLEILALELLGDQRRNFY
ncbi:MAG TPA: hypothetical protein VKP30_30475, partial [Polyangiaceae bacterium]|nr:hypothetical protein [Polyangiaceae bacterium]